MAEKNSLFEPKTDACDKCGADKAGNVSGEGYKHRAEHNFTVYNFAIDEVTWIMFDETARDLKTSTYSFFID